MKRKQLQLIILSIVAHFSMSGQVNDVLFDRITGTLKDSDLVYFDRGKSCFLREAYLEAIPYFEKVADKNQGLLSLQYLTGICYAHDDLHTYKALQLITNAATEAAITDGYYFNLAYAYEKNDSSAKAIQAYQIALNNEQKRGGGKNSDLTEEIQYRMNRCKKMIAFKTKQNITKITNIGKPVNTEASEYCPLITANESMMIYTYRGSKSKGGKQALNKNKKEENLENPKLYYEDIFISKKINDSTWSEPVPIESLNTTLHDAAVSLNADGTQLFIYRNNGAGRGDLYLSTWVDNQFSKPEYQSGLNSNEWEGSACFLPDQNKIIFASERKGGYGGKDLYSAEKIKKNLWGNIKNLGPLINTKHDEDAPFITVDGKIMFFSSNSKHSMGGYDIFRSDISNNVFQAPYNLGPPINTKNDDKFFMVRADGKVGYYSSYKQGGKGEQDIYKIEPGIPGKPVEMLEVNGNVSLDGKPVSAEVEINSIFKNNRFKAKIKAQPQNGSFITHLASEDKYEVVVKLDKYPQQVIELSTINIDSFVVLNVFVEFYSIAFDKKLQELMISNKEEELKKNTLAGNFSFAGNYGNLKKEGLNFRVQIGAYKFFENFNYNHILGFPKIDRQIGTDQITRFVMGNYETFNEAADLLKRLKKTGVLQDAFVIAELNGERKNLHQLLSEKIVE